MPRPLRALLVEDNEDDALLVARELRKSGFTPATARVETREAMQQALEQARWDVVIADYSLPGFSAVAALELLRAHRLDLPFIVVSGVVGEETAVAAMRAGAHDFIVKGNWARLGPAIERELLEASNRRERSRSDRALRFLAEASRDLTGSLDVESTIERVARLGVPELADWAGLYLDDRDGLGQAAQAHAPLASPSLVRDIASIAASDQNGDHPIATAFRTGRSQLLSEVTAEDWRRMAAVPDATAPIEAPAVRSFIAVPLLARGRVIGVLGFARADERRAYDSADLALAGELAWRAALAIDNARLYAAERRARSEAEAAVHLRDEFLSVAAHELKTPVTSLQASAQLTLRRMDRQGSLDPSRVARAFQLIDQQSHKLSQLIGQLLDVSRLEAGKLALDRAPTDLVALIGGLVEAARARTDLHPFVVSGPSHLFANVDVLRIEQVVANLIDNAIKYSPNGGEIDVDLQSSDERACIAVRDHGLGIPPERRNHIFDRFYQAHAEPSLGGLGLGLYISQQIVELHQGNLSVEFPPDGGTRFVVCVPRDLDEGEVSPDGVASSGADRGTAASSTTGGRG